MTVIKWESGKMVYIARFRGEKGIVTQDVKNHLQNVSTLCRCFGSKIKMKNFCFLCGLIHDIGKYSDEFQCYIRQAIQHTIDGDYDIWKRSVMKIDHGVYGAKFISELLKCDEDILIKDIISTVVCYHHGSLPDTVENIKSIPLKKRIAKCDDHKYAVVLQRFKKDVDVGSIDNLIILAKKEIYNIYSKLCGDKEKAFYLNLIIKSVYSILIDSDHLDSYYFSAGIDFDYQGVYIPDKNGHLWSVYLEALNKKLNDFEKKTVKSDLEKTVNEVRCEISDKCFNFGSRETGVYKLTVPTGGGKTFSALRFALKHAMKNGKERIFFIVPYTSIIEQNADEVRKVLHCNDSLLEYHHNVINENNEGEKLTCGFDSPIIFTTMVQFLNCFYDSGTQNTRKIHNFFNSIIIFDEIQKVPTHCVSLFNSSVNYLKLYCNTTLVLCTATQPNLDEVEKPIMFSEHPQIVSDYNVYYEKLRRMVLINCCSASGYTYNQAGDFVLKKKLFVNSILLVLNTISSAEKMYYEIDKKKSDDIRLYYLSTHLCPDNRKNIITEIRCALDRKEQIICISTQLIEAGVNMSFDTVVRSKCGLDSAAQATGRGNRHGENSIGQAYIINIKDENVDKIPEILVGQQALGAILDNDKNHNLDLLSTEAIEKYYRYYNNDVWVKRQQDYKIGEDDSVYNMLSNKKNRNTQYYQETGNRFPMCFNMLFQSAGKSFKVIDDNTTTIIVPYKKGKEIISRLNTSLDVKEKRELIEQAQQYSVNVRNYLFYQLNNCDAIETTSIEGVYSIKDAFYHEIIGVTANGKLTDLQL